MALVSLKCPNCGGLIQMDNTLERGFCMYCGSPLLLKDEIQRIQVEHVGAVHLKIDREEAAENLIIRAEQKIEEFKSRGDSIDVYYSRIIDDYIEKALDISPKNPKIHELRNRLKNERDKEHERIAEEKRIIKQKIDARDKLLDKIVPAIIGLIFIALIIWFMQLY